MSLFYSRFYLLLPGSLDGRRKQGKQGTRRSLKRASRRRQTMMTEKYLLSHLDEDYGAKRSRLFGRRRYLPKLATNFFGISVINPSTPIATNLLAAVSV